MIVQPTRKETINALAHRPDLPVARHGVRHRRHDPKPLTLRPILPTFRDTAGGVSPLPRRVRRAPETETAMTTHTSQPVPDGSLWPEGPLDPDEQPAVTSRTPALPLLARVTLAIVAAVT